MAEAKTDVSDKELASIAADAEKSLYPQVGTQQLKITVIQAKELPKADFTGHSDPYCVVRIGDKRYETAYIKDTGEPVWNHKIDLVSYDLLEKIREHGIVFEIFDKDDVSKDDFLGHTTLRDVEQFVDKPPQPIWLLLHSKDGKKVRGQLEVAIQIVSEASKVAVRQWTHLIEVDVVGVKGLDRVKVPWAFAGSKRKRRKGKKGAVGTINPRVRLEWSTQVMTTSSSDEPASDKGDLDWNQRCYLFMDTARHAKYLLKLRLESGAGRKLKSKDVMPEGFIAAGVFFEAASKLPSTHIRKADKSKDAAKDDDESSSSEDFTDKLDDFKDDIADCVCELPKAISSKITKFRGKRDKEMELSIDCYEVDVPLRCGYVAKDSELASLDAAGDTEDAVVGSLTLRFSVNKRKVVEENFYSALIDKCDKNGDGALQYDELQSLIMLMEFDTPASELHDWLEKFSIDKDHTLDKEELMGMLRDHTFTSSRLFSNMFFRLVQHSGDGDDIITRSLMTSITRETFKTSGRKVIEVKDRTTGLIVCENVPDYVWYALKLMYSSVAGRMLSTKMTAALLAISVRQGAKYDTKESAAEIDSFIALHSLKTDEILKSVDEFETFNDFFARAIKLESRPMPKGGEEMLVSAADCRLMAFSSFLDSTAWVKGAKFTTENVLGPRKELSSKIGGGPFVIFRLAPQDYHRWHWPVSGKVTKITPIDGALYTVNPLAINSDLDVYSENKRCVIEIDTGDDSYGLVILVAIAATAVGSYILFKEDGTKLNEGDDVVRGEVSGEFRFGGSTVLMFMEPGRVKLDGDLLSNSMLKLETLVRCRSKIGVRVLAAAASES